MSIPTQDYEYNGRLLNIVDGDTVDIEVDLGFSISQKMRMRLLGIDCPETNSKDPTERALAQKAKAYVMQFLGRECVIKTYKKDKYGRYLCELFVFDGQDKEKTIWINLELMALGLAIAYDGGTKAP